MHRARRVGELFAAFVVEDLHAAGRGEDVDPLEGVVRVPRDRVRLLHPGERLPLDDDAAAEVRVVRREGGVLDDPLANSYLQNLYAPDPDPNMEIVLYDRTWEQNEELGLNDMKVEDYEEDAEADAEAAAS